MHNAGARPPPPHHSGERHPPPCHSEEHYPPPCHSEERYPPPCHSEERYPPPCHSEERTTKNLRCLLTRRTVVVTGRPSERDLRFLTAVRNDREGVRNDSEGFGTTAALPLPVTLRSAILPHHSEERTTKNLRCWLMRWVVVVMVRSLEGDLRFLTPFGMTGGGSE